jgi:hypothetical protein
MIVAAGVATLGVVCAGCVEPAGPPQPVSVGSSHPPARSAGRAPPGPVPRDADADISYYRDRAAALASGATTEIAGTNFVRLRRGRLYLYGAFDKKAFFSERRLTMAVAQGDTAAILAVTGEILADDQADIRAHMLRAIALRETGNDAEASFQREIAISLIASIVQGGDGRGFDSAWTVFREKEEYEVLKANGYLVDSQSLLPRDRQMFDVLQAHKVDGGQKVVVYFDITELFAQGSRCCGGATRN